MEKLFYLIFVISLLICGCQNNVEKGAEDQMKKTIYKSTRIV